MVTMANVGDVFAVRGDRQRVPRSDVSLNRPQATVAGGAPDLYATIRGTTYKKPTVRREAHARDVAHGFVQHRADTLPCRPYDGVGTRLCRRRVRLHERTRVARRVVG